MPNRDGTGPSGLGAGSGRRQGLSCPRGSGVSGVILQFLVNNWLTILGFLITTVAPLIGRKLYLENKAEHEKIPVLTARKVDQQD